MLFTFENIVPLMRYGASNITKTMIIVAVIVIQLI